MIQVRIVISDSHFQGSMGPKVSFVLWSSERFESCCPRWRTNKNSSMELAVIWGNFTWCLSPDASAQTGDGCTSTSRAEICHMGTRMVRVTGSTSATKWDISWFRADRWAGWLWGPDSIPSAGDCGTASTVTPVGELSPNSVGSMVDSSGGEWNISWLWAHGCRGCEDFGWGNGACCNWGWWWLTWRRNCSWLWPQLHWMRSLWNIWAVSFQPRWTKWLSTCTCMWSNPDLYKLVCWSRLHFSDMWWSPLLYCCRRRSPDHLDCRGHYIWFW